MKTPDTEARVVRTSTPVHQYTESPGVSFTHPYRLLAVLVLYLLMLGACGWWVTRWADYPPDAQPYTKPLRTRPPGFDR